MSISQGDQLVLLSNESATGSQKVSQLGGRYVFRIDGTFGGTTAQLEMLSPDGSSWLALSGASFTAEGTCTVEVPQGGTYRVSLTGGTPSAMYATMDRVIL